MQLQNETFETLIENSPHWLKSFYVTLVIMLKRILAITGILSYLDKHAKTNPTFHYIRSLFSIYQLEDMIQLDVPWWTYPAIATIEEHIRQLSHPAEVFEYGSGASTIWLAKRCAQIFSVEHHQEWFNKLQKNLNHYPNVALMLIEPDKRDQQEKFQSKKEGLQNFSSYVKAIQQYKQPFDIIIIDGRCRVACLEECLSHLKPDGIIVFDNSNRTRYQIALNQPNLEIHRFFGRVPGSPFKSETAIIKKRSN